MLSGRKINLDIIGSRKKNEITYLVQTGLPASYFRSILLNVKGLFLKKISPKSVQIIRLYSPFVIVSLTTIQHILDWLRAVLNLCQRNLFVYKVHQFIDVLDLFMFSCLAKLLQKLSFIRLIKRTSVENSLKTRSL